MHLLQVVESDVVGFDHSWARVGVLLCQDLEPSRLFELVQVALILRADLLFLVLFDPIQKVQFE